MESALSEKISLINHVVLECMGNVSQQEIIRSFTNVAIKIMQSDYGYAFLWDDKENKFELSYQDQNTPYIPQTPRETGITAQVFTSKTPRYIKYAAISKEIRDDAKQNMKGVVVIPMFYHETNYGVLDLCYYNEHIFSDDEKKICTYIGNAAAQAITINRLVLKEQEARMESEGQRARFQALIENSHEAIGLINPRGEITYTSPSIARISGYLPEELTGLNISVFIHPQDIFVVNQSIGESMQKAGSTGMAEFRFRHKDGSWRWLESTWLNMTENPAVGSVVANVRDITERKEHEKTITHQASHDALTGLPNRQEFAPRAEQALEQAKRNNHRIAVMFLDMDRFKNVNDRLGHSTGDILLKVVASRIDSCLRAEDIAARFGGDEFLILVNEIRSGKDAAAVAGKILRAVNLPVKIGAQTLYPSVSIGVAMYPNDGLDLESLKKNADIALYRAKENGRNRFSLYDHSLNDLHEAERFTLENELRQALQLNQFVVYYQPIISLKKSKLVAVEALARWAHPQRGLLLPAEFISLAEETGLISELDKIVLRQVCQQAKEWQEMDLPKFRVAVNLSAQHFSEADFVSGVAGALAETGLMGDTLEVEITESLAMSNLELTRLNFRDLKKLGVRIIIDDFGTGYSSLNYLKRFPIHGLKVDRAFVKNCITSPADTSIVKAIVAMAQAMSLKVTAEGVDEPTQMGFLNSLGCDSAQGFFIAKPMPAKDLPGWIKAKYPAKELIITNNHFSF